MTKKPMIVSTAAALALFLSGQAYALTLTNRDTAEQRVQIYENGAESAARDVVLAADQTLEGLCEEGCTIVLESGAEQSFEGYEAVFIEDGQFLTAE